MGNKPLSSSGNSFTKEECDVLQTTFRDLADRSTVYKSSKGPCCDKETFLRFFSNVPGLVGERLFHVFDSKKDGMVDFEEFLQGLKIISRGSHMEKVEFLFQIFDMDANKRVSFSELEALLATISDALKAREDKSELNGISLTALALDAFPDKRKALDRPRFDLWVGQHPEILQLFDFAFTGTMLSAPKESAPEVKMDISGVSHDQTKRVSVFVSKSRHSGHGISGLSTPKPQAPSPPGDRFSLPSLLGSKGSSSSANPSSPSPAKTQNPQIRTQGFTVDQALMVPGGRRLHCAFCGYVLLVRHCFKCGGELDGSDRTQHINCVTCGELFAGLRHCISCGSDIEPRPTYTMAATPRAQAAVVTSPAALRKAEPKEGYMFKIGKRMGRQKQMWYILRDHFLYSFKKRKDEVPKQVLFMEGCYIEAVNHEQQHAKLKYGIEVIVSEQPKKVSRFLYAESIEDRNSWISSLQEHANVHNVDDYYVVGRELGVGRFATVREAISKSTGEMFAIKIIDKFQLDEKEREALRTEVAVMKLVSHPNIVRLQTVFETRRQIHIVMSFVPGGDLFDRIDQQKNFDEMTARPMMQQLCSAVKYLHARGIVHRDLKPENLMMASKTSNDIIIGDFGLSKFTGTREQMNIACGTLAYVAPEVLTGQGYGKGVDLWSVGVIMYLILRGRLPFDDEDEEALIEKTKEGIIPFGHAIWDEISPEAKDLVRGLLRVDPEERLNIDQVLNHPWFRITLPFDRGAMVVPTVTTRRPSSAAVLALEKAPMVTRVGSTRGGGGDMSPSR